MLVFDFGYTKWDKETLCLLKKNWLFLATFGSENVQKQQGGKEYGLYIIANATSITLQILHALRFLPRIDDIQYQ